MQLKKLLGGRQTGEPALTDVQERVLESLRADGVAVVDFADLFEDGPLWEELAQDIGGFVDETGRTLPGMSGEDIHAAYGKTFLVRRYRKKENDPTARRPKLALDNPWLRFGVSAAVLGIVNAYRGDLMRLVDFDNWYTIPSSDRAAREASQKWHRDPWEDHILKVFTYFSDVGEDAGPFEYVRCSAPGARYGSLWPWEESGVYPPQDEFVAAIDKQDFKTLTGSAGTMIFCDTAGFHRGGFARTKPRVLSYHTYISTDAQQRHSKKFEVDASAPDALSEESRFALG